MKKKPVGFTYSAQKLKTILRQAIKKIGKRKRITLGQWIVICQETVYRSE